MKQMSTLMKKIAEAHPHTETQGTRGRGDREKQEQMEKTDSPEHSGAAVPFVGVSIFPHQDLKLTMSNGANVLM